ncbi:MAG TPA: hypothetical protein VH796_09955 [Nitrososphaeraceae archaeon]|jgi:arginyl-tRNA synthetase
MDNESNDGTYRSLLKETTSLIKSDDCDANFKDSDYSIQVDDWSKIYSSKALAKTMEGMLCGNVVAEYNDNIVLIDFDSSNLQEYLVPKSIIERFDGTYFYLTISHNVLKSYGF